MKFKWPLIIILSLAALAFYGCKNSSSGGGGGGGNGTAAATSADILADFDRDGQMNPATDQSGEENWSKTGGAVSMANIDDDDSSGNYDFSDDAQPNGDSDLSEMARFTIRRFETIDPVHYGEITLNADSVGRCRIFRYDSQVGAWGVYDHNTPAQITAADIAGGDITFAVEVMDLQETNSGAAGLWDGMIDVTFTIRDSGGSQVSSNTLRLYNSPYILLGNLHPATEVYVCNYDDGSYNNDDFVASLRTIVEGLGMSLTVFQNNDVWVQDQMEIGYQSMPSASGENVMPVVLNSPRQRGLYNTAYDEIFGVDYGLLQISSTTWSSHDSFGNLEVTPPCNGYPLGRTYIGGSGSEGACDAVKTFLGAQAQAEYLEIDTTWLLVGHVDEIMAFAPANNSLGWKLCLASPTVARNILQDMVDAGKGSYPVFEGKSYQTTVSSLLNYQVSFNETCQTHIDTVRSTMKSLLGIGESDIIDLPVIFEDYGGMGALTRSPGVVNFLVLDSGNIVISDPFGPMDGGTDKFKEDIDSKLTPTGLTVHYIDDWTMYHVNMGEVHCGTNARRTPSFGAPWWTLVNK